MSRKRKLDVLPSVEEMCEELERERIVVKKFRKYYGKIVSIALDEGGSKLSKLGESEKATWLIATCGFDTVATISRCIQSLPVGMTNLQRVRAISDCASLPVDRARFLTEFIESHCPSLLETFKDNNFTPVTVLAPPVSTCYDCDEDLVVYHECDVHLYTAQGVHNVRKITLRCTRCNLLYQYAKYGDKRERGFRFYPSQRDAVEASDVVYLDRTVFELQCNLA